MYNFRVFFIIFLVLNALKIRMTKQSFQIVENSQKQMPCNIEAEQAVIGSILVSNDIYDEISPILDAQKFFDPIHVKIFETIENLISKGLLANPITLKNHFENSDEIRNDLKNIYKKEMNSFDNTVAVATKYYNLTKSEYQKRLKVMEYLLNLAFIDGDFSKAEFMITEDIANALQIKRSDFENMIARFEQFYAEKQNSKELSLENACDVLGVNVTDDMKIIKKKYRELVKKNHPDIITGQGASQSIIDEATEKLQEINAAYEIIKKEKS